MKTITNLVYNFVRKQLAKNNMGQGKGITSLPNAADIEIGMTDVYNNLRKGGFDAVSAGKTIKSEDDLARTLAEINALDRDKKLMKEFQQQLNQDPNRLDIIIDKMNKGIPLNKGDQFALEGSGFETQLDAFKGFEPKVIQGGKSEKELLEKMNKQNKEAVERIKKRKDTDPDKKAEGGRTGYFKGGIAALLKLLQSKVGKKAITTADKIDRPESAKLRDEFKAFEKRTGNKKSLGEVVPDDYNQLVNVPLERITPGILRVKYPGITDNLAELIGNDTNLQRKAEAIAAIEQALALRGAGKSADETIAILKGEPETKMSKGGLTRLGFANGSPPSIKLFPRAQGKITDQKAGTGGNAPNITLRDIDYGITGLIKDDKFFGGAEIDKGKVKIDVVSPEGNTLFKDTISKDDAINFILGAGDPIGDKFQIKTDKDFKNMQITVRKKFEKGSPPSKGRRNFLKLMGGLAALPVVGKFFKFAKPASTAVQAAKEATDVPSYFPKLVEKIKLLGDDVTSTAATGERQVVKEYKGYELTESLDTGSLSIKRDNYTSEEYLDFTPGGQYYDETRKKVIKYPDSYEEVTVKPDAEGKMKDVDFGLDSYDDILDEVGETKIKKAGGGLAYMLGM
jgi:hypothetical protein